MTHIRTDWRWLDRITNISDDETVIEARRVLEPREWYFEHHFRGFPVMPGVFLLEAMAHTAGMLQTARALRREARIHNHVMTHVEDLRFYRFARPGDEIVLTATVEEDASGRILARTRAVVRGANVARARLVLHRIDSSTEGFPSSTDHLSDPIGAYGYLRELLDDHLRQRYGISELDCSTGASSGVELASSERKPPHDGATS